MVALLLLLLPLLLLLLLLLRLLRNPSRRRKRTRIKRAVRVDCLQSAISCRLWPFLSTSSFLLVEICDGMKRNEII